MSRPLSDEGSIVLTAAAVMTSSERRIYRVDGKRHKSGLNDGMYDADLPSKLDDAEIQRLVELSGRHVAR